MIRFKVTVLLAALLTANSGFIYGEDKDASPPSEQTVPSVEERKARIKEMIKLRRKAALSKGSRPRETDSLNPSSDGAVYQARPKNGDQIASLKVVDLPVGVVAQFYADISGKEVMVSSEVFNRKLRLELGNLGLDEATAAFEDSLKRLDIRIVHVSESIVALIDDTP